MNNLPLAFIEKMKKQLPKDEWEAFFAVYKEKPYKGARINPLKGSAEEIKKAIPFLGEKIAWEENGYYATEEKVGASPFHHAGLFYSQEPSAMSVVPFLEVRAGEKVLDLCSAPGGKGTQLASYLKGEGILVVNEPFSQRAKILSQNIERMGVKNAVVLSAKPEELSGRFSEYFDKILIDAPCSGEGMFRKNAEEALAEWSEENVALCAIRQKQILDEGTKMLKVNGRLAYSTCTFSIEEDEGQVLDYLKSHPEMRLIREEKIYPHKQKGEGHFFAIFEKVAGGEKSLKPMKPRISSLSEKAYKAFEKDFLKTTFENLHEANGVLYALPKGVFDLQGLPLLRAGVRLGEIKNGRFEPCHALCMAVKASDCKRVAEIEDAEKYLRGETVISDIENGWCVVSYKGYILGLGKAVNGTVKNHLPKGLRKV